MKASAGKTEVLQAGQRGAVGGAVHGMAAQKRKTFYILELWVIPDPNFFHPGSGSALKNVRILIQKIVSKLSEI
jgi:hypothetical protein